MRKCVFRSRSGRAANRGARISRANFRRLRLEFPQDGPTGTPFSALKKVKLVTHCGALDDESPRLRIACDLELLLYQVFNRVSPQSFRVRPLDVTYVDTDRGQQTQVHPGFLIEPEGALAKRLDIKEVDVVAFAPRTSTRAGESRRGVRVHGRQHRLFVAARSGGRPLLPQHRLARAAQRRCWSRCRTISTRRASSTRRTRSRCLH